MSEFITIKFQIEGSVLQISYRHQVEINLFCVKLLSENCQACAVNC